MTDPATPAGAQESGAPPAGSAPGEDGQDPSRRRRHKAASKSVRFKVEEEASTWLITYADMITVLLSLFVILVSMMSYVKVTGSPDQPVPQAQLHPVFIPVFAPSPNPLAQYGDGAPPSDRPPPLPVFDTPTEKQAASSWASRASRQLQDSLAREQLGREALVQQVDRHVVVRLGDSVLFDLGRADLRPDGAAVLNRLAPVLKRLESFIRVEGHTDDLPISTPRFPSNWELSAGRAAAVVRQLIEAGVPPQMVEAVGFADTRPLVRGTSTAARTMNRRVSFVILPPEGSP